MKQFIKRYREAAGLTQHELSERTKIPLKTIQDWEQTGRSPRDMQRLVPVADALGCSTDDLLGRTLPNNALIATTDVSSFVDVPLYGSIAAGTPIEMIETEDTHPIPTKVYDNHRKAFLLKVEGESMNHILPNGCYALVDPTSEIEKDNDPYAVCVNGYDATIKRVKKLANGFQLVPDSTDPTYPVQTFNYNEPGTETITVIGRVVYYVLPFDWSF